MDIANTTRIVVIPIIVVSLWRQILHVYNDKNLLSRYSGVNYLVSGGLAIVATATSIPRPTSLWLHSICVLSTHQALLVYYFNFEQVTQGKLLRFYKEKRYIIVTLVSLFLIVLDYFRRNNLAWFVDDVPFRPTVIYYSSHILFYSVGMYIGTIGIIKQYQFIKNTNYTVYMIRNWLGLLLFFIISLASTTVETSIVVSIFYGNIYRYAINQFYHELRLIFGITILLASAPASILADIFAPVNYLVLRRQHSKQNLITFLHEKFTRVVPVVRLPLDQGEHSIRKLIEIGDARDILWSHTNHPTPITAKEEAELLFSLEHRNITINEPGVYQSPVIQYDVMEHNLRVASHLRKLEQRRNANTQTRIPPSNPSTRRPSSSR